MLIGGTVKTFDASVGFKATITYLDGTTANVTAMVFQTTDGELYLAPEFSANADQANYQARPISAITLNSPIYADGVDQGFYLIGDRQDNAFVPCFTAGTMIATSKGEVAAEALTIGDRVFTRDNGIQDIVWVGQRTLTAEALAAQPKLQPVMVRAGALGPNAPETDLLVSPNHQMLITDRQNELYFNESEVLVAAKHLVHLDGIDRVTAQSDIIYVHIMCVQHEVVLSNGAWAESFQPGDYSLRGIGDAQRKELITLFPELATFEGVSNYVAARATLRSHEAKLIN